MITDEMLSEAARTAAIRINDSLPVPAECDHQFSAKFDRRMKKLILASQSPRRRGILETAQIPFEVEVSHVSEETDQTKPAKIVEAVRVLATRRQGENHLNAEDVPCIVDDDTPGQLLVSAFRKYKK